MATSTPRYLTSSEAAAQIGISLSTLHRSVDDGRINVAATAGRDRLFDPAEVERVRAAREELAPKVSGS